MIRNYKSEQGGLQMRTWLAGILPLRSRITRISMAGAVALLSAATAYAQPASEAAGEASLKVPDLSQVQFLGVNGHTLLMWGILFCIFGLLFGMMMYSRLKNLPVHQSMREMSELIYETCKTYLITQGKFLMLLESFIAVIIVLYFGVLRHMSATRVIIILAFSVLGICGSYGVAWFGIRVNTFANSRTAFAALRGQAFSDLPDSAERGHEHRHDADQRRVADDADYFAVRAGELLPGRASSGSPSANRWARRRCESRAASSRRSRTSART